MGGQRKGLGGYAAVKVLPAVALGGGKAAVALVAAAALQIGEHHQHRGAPDNGGVPGDGGFFGDAGFQRRILHGDVADDLGVLPAGGKAGGFHQLLQQLMGNLLFGEFPHTAAGSDAFQAVHRAAPFGL